MSNNTWSAIGVGVLVAFLVFVVVALVIVTKNDKAEMLQRQEDNKALFEDCLSRENDVVWCYDLVIK